MKRKQFLITIMMVITMGIMTGCGSNNTTSTDQTATEVSEDSKDTTATEDDRPNVIKTKRIDIETYEWKDNQYTLDTDFDGVNNYVRYPGSDEILTWSEMSEEEVSDWLDAVNEWIHNERIVER